MRKLLFGCVLSVPVLVGLAFAPEAEARPPESCHTLYYSDATWEVLVGEDTLTCGAQRIRWGITTPYYEELCTPCY